MRAHLQGQRGGKSVEVGIDESERVAQLQNQTGVDDVLAGRAPMDIAARGDVDPCHLRSQRRDEGDRQIARIECRSA